MTARILTYVAMIVLAASCSGRYPAVGEFQTLPEEALAYTDSVEFTLSNLDTLPGKNLYVAVVHSNAYPYSNLWLEVTYKDSLHTECDTIGLTMADPYGKWAGNAVGSTYQVERAVCTGFNPSGDAKVRVRHIMRADTLPGIVRIGVLAK